MKRWKMHLVKSRLVMPAALFIVFSAHWAVSGQGGFLQVTGPCRLAFPADHGPHPGYRTEWWYYTGNLVDGQQRAFGFQLTFFRSRLEPPAAREKWPQPASAWRSDEIYMAHAALTDVAGGRHLQAEKTARPVLGLAGAEDHGDTWKIYLQSWQADISPEGHQLQADAGGFALKLDLKSAKPPVLHGDNGYSRKGQAPERASCYYSFTRLQAHGSISLEGKVHPVEGTAWMDHEFSSAPLAPGIIGWDWFGLQLDDRTEIMIYLLRQSSGNLNPASSGTFVMPSGKTRHLRRSEIRVEPLAFWTSPRTRARYPVKWKLAIDVLQCELTVTADPADQEMRTPRSTRVDYWEGRVKVRGTREAKAIEGVGYVELTGYARPFHAPM